MSSIVQVQQELLGRMDQIKQAVTGPTIAPASHFGVDGTSGVEGTGRVSSVDIGNGEGFRTAFADVFKAVDAQQHKASAMAEAVDSGASDDLVGAMVESQKASVAFSALMQVRNKVTGAFEEVMRMPL
ncbi:flagellar hook-basal body complex protein FliE [Cellvibrio mixtus]|uniref:flagellar hook-basal body complex protein FliE n=1 Tax=Cellvibrio mixtus TaxID=39650 RepID=UPI000586FFB7|nr:flagellar hook-basal body complex protein FliE [Cellvibrio mixtus]